MEKPKIINVHDKSGIRKKLNLDKEELFLSCYITKINENGSP